MSKSKNKKEEDNQIEKPKKSYVAIYGVPDKKNFHESCLKRLNLFEKQGIIRDIRFNQENGKIILGEKQRSYSKFTEIFGDDQNLWGRVKTFFPENNQKEEAYIIRAEVIDGDSFSAIRFSLEHGLIKENVVDCFYYDFNS